MLFHAVRVECDCWEGPFRTSNKLTKNKLAALFSYVCTRLHPPTIIETPPAMILQVRTECRHLDHDSKTRLAIAFANCHLSRLGKPTYTCTERMPLKACVSHKDQEFYFAHLQFFSEVDRCLPIPPSSLRHLCTCRMCVPELEGHLSACMYCTGVARVVGTHAMSHCANHP